MKAVWNHIRLPYPALNLSLKTSCEALRFDDFAKNGGECRQPRVKRGEGMLGRDIRGETLILLFWTVGFVE